MFVQRVALRAAVLPVTGIEALPGPAEAKRKYFAHVIFCEMENGWVMFTKNFFTIVSLIFK